MDRALEQETESHRLLYAWSVGMAVLEFCVRAIYIFYAYIFGIKFVALGVVLAQ